MTDAQRRSYVIKRLKIELNSTITSFPNNKERALDQAFGLVRGVGLAYNDDPLMYPLLRKVWGETTVKIEKGEVF